MADAGLVAADTGADIVGPPRPRLVRHFRIADHGPRHPAHVGRTFGEDALGLMGLVDAAGNENGGTRRLLQLRRIGRQIGVVTVMGGTI